jgi:hypothetical protein
MLTTTTTSSKDFILAEERSLEERKQPHLQLLLLP